MATGGPGRVSPPQSPQCGTPPRGHAQMVKLIVLASRISSPVMHTQLSPARTRLSPDSQCKDRVGEIIKYIKERRHKNRSSD